MNPLKFVKSDMAYIRFKAFLWRHSVLHYFFHLTLCRLIEGDHYNSIPWVRFKANHKKG